MYEKIKNDRLTFPSDIEISGDARDLITKMLEKDPSKRITLPQIKVIFTLFVISRHSTIITERNEIDFQIESTALY